MPHKLLFRADLRIPERYHAYLDEHEAVRGLPLPVTVFAKNIGETPFPGGTFESLSIDQGGLGGGMLVAASDQHNCPPIELGHETEVFAEEFTFYVDGLAWLRLSVKPSDDEKVEYYQSEDGKAHNEWVMPIFFVNRELLAILEALNRLQAR